MNDMSDPIKINTQRARQASVADSSKCRTCERVGVPIMPLRYAVLPKYTETINAKLLAPTLGQGVTDTPLEKFHYGLRSLREGFLYVYLEAHDVWQTYAVTPQGYLTICRDHTKPTATETQELTHACVNKAHDVAASFIHIPNIKSTPVIWLAFSQDAWTKKVLNNYRKLDLRKKRMTRLDLTAFKTAPTKQPHAFEIDPSLQSLHANVAEYAKTEQAGIQRGGWMEERYHFGDTKTHDQLRKDHPVWSVHRFWSRHDRLGETKRVVFNSKKDFQMPVAAIALMDTAGMVQELNAARLTVVEQRQAYVSEPGVMRQQQVSNAIVGLKKIVEATTNALGSDEKATEAHATWAKMEKFYSEGKRKVFENEYAHQLKQYRDRLEIRGRDYAAWAKHPDWIKLFNDYDSSDTKSSMSLTCMAAPCLSGGPTDQATLDIWKKWLSKKPDDDTNPVYLAMFGNRKEIVQHFTPQGSNPNKSDQLYDAVKALADAKEFEKHIKEPVLAAVSHIQLAATGAASLLGNKLGPTGDAILVRAQQAAMLLYAKMEITILKVKMTVGDYQKLMSELAFKKIDKAVSAVLKEGGRTVKSLALAGILRIDNPQVRNTVIEVTIWSLERAEVIQNQLKLLTRSAYSTTLGNIKLHALSLSGEAAKTLGQIERVALNSAQVATLAKQLSGKALRAAGQANVVLAGGAIFFQGWSFKDSMKDVQNKLGAQKNEALMSLASAGFGVFGASVELAGHLAKNWAGTKGTSLYMVGVRLVKTGGVLAAVSAVFDGMEAFFAVGRTWGAGDKDAGAFYIGSGLSFVVGAAFAGYAAYISAVTLLGPFGIGLALIVIGAVLFWAAVNAEDTPMQVWLDRCVFGNGKRGEGRWTNAQIADEMAGLNAIILGLNAELEWEDKRGMDGVKARLTFPGFDIKDSFYEYTISAKDNKGAWVPAAGGKYDPGIAHQHHSWTAQNAAHLFKFSEPVIGRSSNKKENVLVLRDFRLEDAVFTDVKIEVRYLPVKSDPEAVAALTLIQKD